MSESPKVSIILPTYNRADIIEQSIASVLDQTFEDFELIVVDDASTDDTQAVIEAIEDPRVEYLRHRENQGSAAARNTGISEAVGEFIAFQDSDDEWHLEKLEKQMEYFRSAGPEVGVVYSGCWRTVNGEKKYLPYEGVNPKEGNIQSALLHQNFVPTQVAVVRRECFQTVGGFDKRTPPIDDWELWLRISEEYEFRLVDEPLVNAQVISDSISRDQEALVDAREYVVNKHREKFDNKSLANHLFYIGHGAMQTRQTGRGRRYLRRAVQTDPSALYAIAYCLSFLGPEIYSKSYNFVKFAKA